MGGRGERTREQLLDVAEQLFGERGVRNVSLREIRLTARQGNAAAVQYHFGDREGVVAALHARHAPRIGAIQAEYHARLDQMPRPTLWARVDVLVRPLADYVTRGPSERAWVKIAADLLSDPRVSVEMVEQGSSDDAVKVGVTLLDELSRRLPPEVAGERIWAVSQFAVHMCANRAKIKDDADNVRRVPSDAAFADDLVDMCLGALTAPSHRRPRPRR